MADVNNKHQPELVHHVRQGVAWLAASAEGENTATLSYAAFELRFAVERLAVHYWALLLDRKIEQHDLCDIESFKQVERRIYDLAGHQNEIDRHFEFMRIALGAMMINMPLLTPKIGKLAAYWQACSKLCHITWPLSCSITEVRKFAYRTLTEISQSLEAHVNSLGWPVLKEVAFTELRNRFVAGIATPDEVLAHFQRIGIWAHVAYTDGRPAHFVGQPVAPNASGSDK